MGDKHDTCDIFYYRSNKYKRIARNAKEAEIQAPVLRFDYTYMVNELVEEKNGRPMKIGAMTDSKTVLNLVAKDGQTTERRL